MSQYGTRYAELYDTFYAEKPYAGEAAFIHGLLGKHAARDIRRVLELACGTGSHAFALEELGYQVIATDGSSAMLDRALGKARQRRSSVEFQLKDMRSLDFPEQSFDAALCLFDSIGYVVTDDGLSEALDGVYRVLRPGGLFVFEFWHALAMLGCYDPLRIRESEHDGGHLIRVSVTNLEKGRRVARVNYLTYELDRDGHCDNFEEIHLNRFFTVEEASEWLARSSFEPVKWFAGFTEDEQISDETWHVVALARRPSSPTS